MKRAFLAALLLAPVLAFAHDEHGQPNWIAKGNFISPDGSHCCGVSDCAQVDASIVHETLQGYSVNGVVLYTMAVWLGGRDWKYHPTPLNVNEFVPRRETLVSQDGNYWRCKRPNGARRCFFVPPPVI